MFDEIETKIAQSFKRAKADILNLWSRTESLTRENEQLKNRVFLLEHNQKRLIENIEYLKANVAVKTQADYTGNRSRETYV
ncbi:MAG: hypothetical protein V1859_11580 [archaeon]